jgi:ABC-type uncharacterized transport system substrate-binding protein
MRRREFLGLVGGAAVQPALSWPRAVRAQQQTRLLRVGVLMGFDESDAEAKGWLAGFVQALGTLGWTNGRNVRIDVRWAAGDVDRIGAYAKEVADLQPDVILAQTTPVTAALHRVTQTIPVVFVMVADAVGEGFVASIPRPGGNLTGFMLWEPSIAGKWLELLHEIAPAVRRVAFMFNPETAPFARSHLLPSFETAARSLKVEPVAVSVNDDADVETLITSLGGEARGGLVVLASAFVEVRRASIISLAARSHVPAVYPYSTWATDGGLLSYGPEMADEFRRAAPYVDRILRGAKPVDLPVQLPVRFQMTLNRKAAKALGLDIPPSIELRADEVIE